MLMMLIDKVTAYILPRKSSVANKDSCLEVYAEKNKYLFTSRQHHVG